ncbi:hypothetical protein OIU85_024734 [Salix viminalis]|uniref:MARVEL domain-containing protein n=1 Tax=Salix viminalis TaxID=40686 RepID=A0A9Q0U1G2_SALVM|nr:hypothetical protein OIU85_024734 [Salix viminalis]
MAQTVGRNIAAPLLFLNLLMYTIALGFACWCTNKYIDGQTSHPSFGGNGATGFFLTFAILACVVGIASKFAGGTHIRVWRSDSLAAAGSASLVAWAITALAAGFACKEINVGGYRGKYGPGYRDTDYGVGAGARAGEPVHKGGAAPVAGTRV